MGITRSVSYLVSATLKKALNIEYSGYSFPCPEFWHEVQFCKNCSGVDLRWQICALESVSAEDYKYKPLISHNSKLNLLELGV